MLLNTVRLIGREKDETVLNGTTNLSFRIFLWKGITNLAEIWSTVNFGFFPQSIFINNLGLDISHASLAFRRSNTLIEDEGIVEFRDVAGGRRRFRIPLGEINEQMFGVLLLGSFPSPITVKIPQSIVAELFVVPAP